MFTNQCIKTLQVWHAPFTNGIIHQWDVDYRLFHQSLLAMNDRIKREKARTTTHGYSFDSLRRVA